MELDTDVETWIPALNFYQLRKTLQALSEGEPGEKRQLLFAKSSVLVSRKHP